MAIRTEFSKGMVPAEVLGGVQGVSVSILDFSLHSMAASDVVEAIKVKAGTVVTDVRVRVITAEGGTCTATVGDGTAANGWDASTDLNAAAGTITSAIKGTDAYAVGKYYSAADTIDLTLGHDTATAKIEVSADYYIPQTA